MIGITSFFVLNTQAIANPVKDQIIKGTAQIERAGKKLNVYQSTQKAIINWKSFDIQKDEHTQFHQPNQQAITLNRIKDTKPSDILGNLSANGTLVLINPNGVFFGPHAKIDVNGLIATSTDIDDTAFMKGRLDFTKPGKPNASIQNYGAITVKQAGLVGLVAPGVINQGIITARLGKVALASGDLFTIDLYGDGLLSLKLSDQVEKQLVSNTGLIEANGGVIALTAAAGREIVDSLIVNKGILQAQTVKEVSGKIILSAKGSNAVSGNLTENKGKKEGKTLVLHKGIIDVSGRDLGEQGGEVQIIGDQIGILDHGVIDASGYSAPQFSDGSLSTMEAILYSVHAQKGTASMDINGRVKSHQEFLSSPNRAGGSIRIGGDYLGKGSFPAAQSVYVSKNARILNNALSKGDGGRTIIWSDDQTYFAGLVQSRGGELIGSGGFLETSGKQGLMAKGYADLNAPYGLKGTYLLDPSDISIYGNVDPKTLNPDHVLWLDASDSSTLIIENNNTITEWRDKSSKSHDFFLNEGKPVLKSESINGLDVVEIGNNERIKTADSNDINLNNRNEFTRSFTFRTEPSVQPRQILYKEGAQVNGFSIYVEKGVLYVGVYNNYGSNISYIEKPVEGDRVYHVNANFNTDQNKFEVSINGEVFTQNALGMSVEWNNHPGDIVFGATDGNIINHSSQAFEEHRTISDIAEAIFYNASLTETARQLLEQYSSEKWDIELTTLGTGSTEAERAMASDGYSVFTTRYLERLSEGANIVLQADNTITLDLKGDSLNLSDDRSIHLTTTTGNILTASTGSILTNRTGSGGNISFASGNNIQFDHDFTLSAQNGGEITLSSSANGSIEIANGVTLQIPSGNLELETNNYTNAGNITGNANGQFSFRQKTANLTLGVGSGGSPDISLSNLPTAFSSYQFGRSDGGDIFNYTASFDGNVSFLSSGQFINETAIISTGSFLVNVGGDLVLNNTITSNASGLEALVLSGGGNFLNSAGASALSAPNGRWLVYLENPTGNQRQSLLPDGSLFGKTYALNSPSIIAAGNWFVYETTTRPVLVYNLGNGSVEYGDPYSGNHTSTYSSGLVGDDQLTDIGLSGSAMLSTSYTQGDDAGIYAGALTASQASLLTKLGYLFQFNTGDLTVTKAPLSIVANNQSREYGEANPNLTGIITGFKLGENANVLNTAPSYATTATQSSDVENYAITASGGLDQNYAFNYTQGTLSINQAMLNVVANDQSREYGETNPSLTGIITGFKLGENANVLNTAPSYATTATPSSDVGSYNITASGGLDQNYAFNYTQGTLSINQAMLNVMANDQSREYGETNPSLTGIITGFKLGENANVLNTAPSYATTATQSSDVENYAITASGGLDQNYAFNYTQGTLSINQAMLNVVANDQSREYGEANPSLTGIITGFKLGENTNVLDTAPSYNTSALQSSDVGSYNITASGGLDQNYAFNYTQGTFTINQAMLNVVADNQSREYGETNPSLTGIITGFKLGQDSNVLDTAPSYTTTATPSSDVGSYNITVSGGLDQNYAFNYTQGTLSINQAMLNVIADNQSREYGETNPSLTGIITGFKLGENANVLDTAPSYNTSALQSSDAGNYAITASGGADQNYAFNYTQGTLSINQAMLNVVANDQSREYGETNPSLTGIITGFKLGQDSNVLDTAPSYATTATPSSDVGNYAITASGGADQNYAFNYTQGTFTINQAMLNVMANDQSREYGEINPSLTGIITGFKLGENANVLDTAPSYNTSALQSSDAGNYAITVSGGADQNYAFNYTQGTLTITQAMLNVMANDQSREYGEANPNLTGIITGFKLGENANVLDTAPSYNTSALQSSDVGSYNITASGGADQNYAFNYTQGTFTINQAMLNVVADNQSREYGEANPNLTGIITGFKLGENANVLDTAPSYNTTATPSSDVGNYAITVSGGLDQNYAFNYTQGTFTINQAMLNVVADNQSREYGETNPSLTGIITGFKLGENTNVLDTAPSYNTTALQSSDVGNYAITVSGGLDQNYAFNYTQGTLSINQAMLNVVADNQSREYGETNPSLTGIITGFKLGQDSNVLDTAPSYNTSALQSSDVGNYAITVSGGADQNYAFNYTQGTFTINQAMLNVVADNQSREYGETNPSLTGIITGFKLGENANVLDTAPSYNTSALQSSDVGNYAITVSGGADQNYAFNYTQGTLTINQAMLNVIADNQSREYGEANPSLTAIITGFKLGQDSNVLDTAPSYNTSALQSSDVGNYAITVSGGADQNYAFNYTQGTLSINQAMLNVVADNQSREYGETNPSLTGIITGFKLGENTNVLDTAPSYNTSALQSSDAGNYAITVSGGADQNYAFNYTQGTLTINQAMLNVVANDQSREYGETNPSLTGIITGFKLGQDSNVLDTAPSYTTTATPSSDVGNYAITASGGADQNYAFNYTQGTFTINQAMLNVVADNQSREYGEANPSLTGIITGFKLGENANVLNTAPSYATTATPSSDVGSYNITASGGLDQNYAFNYTQGTLSINQAMLNVMANDQSREYGETNPSLTGIITGFKLGENANVLNTAPSYATTATQSSDVENYAITTSGGLDQNYAFNYTQGTLSINQAMLNVVANDQSREYGETNPSLTGIITGFKLGQDSNVLDTAPSYNTTALQSSDVGNYAITVSGGLDQNYAFNYTQGTFTINQAMLNVVADNQSREYGETNPSLTGIITGFKLGENANVLDTAPSYATTATPSSDVGSYNITASGGLDQNYAFNYTQGTLSINQAMLNVVANDQSREYGETNLSLTGIITGFKLGQDSNVLDTAPSYNTSALQSSDVGNYAITVSGGADQNYAFNYTQGTLSINQAMLNVVADNQSREYGEANPSLTGIITGFKLGENTNVLDTAPSYNTSALQSSDVGSYNITASGGLDQNYAFNYTQGTFTINQAMLNVVADNQSREYGETNPSLTGIITGFKLGQDSNVLDTAPSYTAPSYTTTATPSSDVGSYNITVSGGLDQNYAFNYTQGTLSINQAMLNVIADNQSREYGETNPSLTGIITGFKLGENANVLDTTPSYNTSALQSSDVGNYAITVSSGLDQNYAFNYTQGTLSIDQAILSTISNNQLIEDENTNLILINAVENFKPRKFFVFLIIEPVESLDKKSEFNNIVRDVFNVDKFTQNIFDDINLKKNLEIYNSRKSEKKYEVSFIDNASSESPNVIIYIREKPIIETSDHVQFDTFNLSQKNIRK